MRIKTLFLTFFVFLVLTSSESNAGTLKISPAKLVLTPKVKTELIYIMNTEDKKISVQMEGKTWNQDANGEDVYTDTKDIVFFPKILTIEPGEKAAVRIGYTKAWPAAENTYRAYIVELPVDKPGEKALKMALRIGIPVFARPGAEPIKPAVPVIEEASVTKTMVAAKVKNTSGNYFMVNKLKAVGFGEDGAQVFAKESSGWYVLGGASKLFQIGSLAPEECSKAKRVVVSAEVMEGQKAEAEAKIGPDACVMPEKRGDTRKLPFKNMSSSAL